MNPYIDAQILQMIALTRTFQEACETAARKDDGIIDQKEKRQLKKINKLSQRFIKDLKKLI